MPRYMVYLIAMIFFGGMISCTTSKQYTSMKEFALQEKTDSGIGLTTDIDIKSESASVYFLEVNYKKGKISKTKKIALHKNQPYIDKVIIPLEPDTYVIEKINLVVKTTKSDGSITSSYLLFPANKFVDSTFKPFSVSKKEIVYLGLAEITSTKEKVKKASYYPLYPLVQNVWKEKNNLPNLTISSLEHEKSILQKLDFKTPMLKEISYSSKKELYESVKNHKGSSVFFLAPNTNFVFFKDLKNNKIFKIKPFELGKDTYYVTFNPDKNAKIQLVGLCGAKDCNWPNIYWGETRVNLVDFGSKSLRLYGKAIVNEFHSGLQYYLGKSELDKLHAFFSGLSLRGFVLDSLASVNNKWDYQIETINSNHAQALSNQVLHDLTRCFNEKVRAVDTHFPTDFVLQLRAKGSDYIIDEKKTNTLSSYAITSMEECMKQSSISVTSFGKAFQKGGVTFYSKSDRFVN